MEEKTDNIDKKLDILITKVGNLENVFVTRREVALIKWVIAIGFSLISMYLAYKGINS